MAKIKKMRGYQMAKQLEMSWNEFQKYTKAIGNPMASSLKTMEESEALVLMAKVRRHIQGAIETKKAPSVPPKARRVEVREPLHAKGSPKNKQADILLSKLKAARSEARLDSVVPRIQRMKASDLQKTEKSHQPSFFMQESRKRASRRVDYRSSQYQQRRRQYQKQKR